MSKPREMVLGIVYSHCANKIELNFHLSTLIILRIILGLFCYPGYYVVHLTTYVLFAMATFFAVDSMVYLVANVSYAEITLVPIILQLLSVIALIQCLFTILPTPTKY